MKLYPNDLFIRLSLHPINSIIITFRCLLKFYFTPEQNSNTEFHLVKSCFTKKTNCTNESKPDDICRVSPMNFHSTTLQLYTRFEDTEWNNWWSLCGPSRSAQWKPYNIISCFVSSVLYWSFFLLKRLHFRSYPIYCLINQIQSNSNWLINILNDHICCQTQNFWDHWS